MGQDNILVLSHIRPDGDTLGSGAALCSALRRAGKTAYIYENPEITDRYLPYVRPWFAPSGFVPDYTVAVDIAEPGLFPLGYAGTVRLCIDHHPSNARYAADLLLRDKKSACGEIVLELIKLLHGAPDRAEATLLYIAISTDTGCFQYSNTNSDTLRAAAETLDAGAGIHDENCCIVRRTEPGTQCVAFVGHPHRVHADEKRSQGGAGGSVLRAGGLHRQAGRNF